MKKLVGDNMKRTALRNDAPAQLPRLREENLIVDDGLLDELLVYDLDRHKAHCLNLSAALVWKHCDGNSTASEIAARVSRKLKQDFPEDAVWLAVRQLEKLHLLQGSVPIPPRFAGLSRREMIRGLGLAAVVAIPVVTSIVAPTAAEASTCADVNQDCSIKLCCDGLSCGAGNICH